MSSPGPLGFSRDLFRPGEADLVVQPAPKSLNKADTIAGGAVAGVDKLPDVLLQITSAILKN